MPRFWDHPFKKCRGQVVATQYVPPSGRAIKGRGYDVIELIKEDMYGVTLFHCQCDFCGMRFTNRELGDWRTKNG